MKLALSLAQSQISLFADYYPATALWPTLLANQLGQLSLDKEL